MCSSDASQSWTTRSADATAPGSSFQPIASDAADHA